MPNSPRVQPVSHVRRWSLKPMACTPRGSQAHKPFILGLTGSVGMGKSTVASMFRNRNVPVLDSDEVVHKLYAKGGAGVSAVAALFPSAIVDEAVDRGALGCCVLSDKAALALLEAAVHPLVTSARTQFLADMSAAGQPLVVLDIPLLYEKGLEGEVEAVVVVSCGAEEQRRRVLARGWSEEKLNHVIGLQMPDVEKRQRATYVIDTSKGLEDTEKDVALLIAQLTEAGARI